MFNMSRVIFNMPETGLEVNKAPLLAIPIEFPSTKKLRINQLLVCIILFVDKYTVRSRKPKVSKLDRVQRISENSAYQQKKIKLQVLRKKRELLHKIRLYFSIII